MSTLFFMAVISAAAAPAVAQQVQFQDVVRMLRHPDAKERLRSVQQLHESGYPEAAEPIAPLIADPDDKVQQAAIEAELSFFMLDDGTRRRFGFLTSRPKSLGLAAFEAGPAAVRPVTIPTAVIDNLLLALDDANDRVRFEAIHALGALAHAPLTVPQTRRLVAALDHYDPVMRAATARVVGRLGVSAAEDALLVMLGDSNQAARQFAMEALGKLRSTRAVPALTQQVEQYRSNAQATWALFALARIADPSSADLFRQYLAAKDGGHRAASAEGLGRLGITDSAPHIQQLLEKERGPSVRLSYLFALQLLGHDGLESLAAALADDGLAPQAMEHLIDLGPAIAMRLTPLLAAANDSVRGRTAEILGLIGTADALPALESVRLDRNEAVARAVAAAIDRIQSRRP